MIQDSHVNPSGPTNAARLRNAGSVLSRFVIVLVVLCSVLGYGEATAPSGTFRTVAFQSSSSGYSEDGTPAISALATFPTSVWADSLGVVYIVDYQAYLVRTVGTDGLLGTLFGTYGVSDYSDSPATGSPFSVTGDSVGNVYITSQDSDGSIRKIDTSTLAVSLFAGRGTETVDGVAATSFYLQFPSQCVIDDSNGDIYVPDIYNNKVMKVSGDIITTLAGSGAQVDYNTVFSETTDLTTIGDNGPATSATVTYPYSIYLNTATRALYIIGQYGQYIRKVNLVTNIITTVAGTGAAASYTDAGDGGAATSAKFGSNGQFLAGDGTNLFIASKSNNYVRVIDSSSIISAFAGQYQVGYNYGDGSPATQGGMGSPYFIFARDNVLYVPDSGYRTVRAVDYTTPIEDTTEPSVEPSADPSVDPSIEPSLVPSVEPSLHPSKKPTRSPTLTPTKKPTRLPTLAPSKKPSRQPSMAPSKKPTRRPSVHPTELPTVQPSLVPSVKPSTLHPSVKPTIAPSPTPTSTKKPTRYPTIAPSKKPTRNPTKVPVITNTAGAGAGAGGVRRLRGSSEGEEQQQE